MKVLVSACLLGTNCKYNGGNNYNDKAIAFLKDKEVVPVCPEVLAGMGIPRTPIELVDGVPMDREGNCVAEILNRAVAAVLEQIKGMEIECAVLQSRSPTCGVNQIYDGSFTGRKIPGSGILAQALKAAGIRVVDVEDL